MGITSIINIENIFIFIIAFFIGRYYKLGKKIIEELNKGNKKEK